jgi:hypothetical protein
MSFIVGGAARGEAAVAADKIATRRALTVFTARAGPHDLVAGGEEKAIGFMRARLEVAVVAEGAVAEAARGNVKITAGGRHQ